MHDTAKAYCLTLFQELNLRKSGSVIFQLETFPTPKPTETIQQRLQQLKEYCDRPETADEKKAFRSKYKFNKQSSYYFYKRFNISYCKVPKVGSTFMMEMFEILTSGYSEVNNSRNSVHSRTDERRLNRTNIWPTVTAARNPFSRLYSAYVDKILLPILYNTSKIITAQLITGNVSATGNICANFISFEQFLRHIVLTALSPEILNRHWAPISSICHLCTTINFMIIKQESFTSDIEKLLEVINVDEVSARRVKDLMDSKRLESTIPGIVKVVLSKKSEYQDCLSDLEVLQKLWQSFQIQGYISDDMPFPIDSIQGVSNRNLADYFSAFVIKQAKMANLTKEQSKEQRERHLKDAYKCVSKETLREIQHLYRADFLMFGYSMEPPT